MGALQGSPACGPPGWSRTPFSCTVVLYCCPNLAEDLPNLVGISQIWMQLPNGVSQYDGTRERSTRSPRKLYKGVQHVALRGGLVLRSLVPSFCTAVLIWQRVSQIW